MGDNLVPSGLSRGCLRKGNPASPSVLFSRQNRKFALHQQVPGADIAWGPVARAGALGLQQVRFDGGDNTAGNPVLQGKDVAQVAIVALRPYMIAVGNVDELRGDADPFSGLSYAASATPDCSSPPFRVGTWITGKIPRMSISLFRACLSITASGAPQGRVPSRSSG